MLSLLRTKIRQLTALLDTTNDSFLRRKRGSLIVKIPFFRLTSQPLATSGLGVIQVRETLARDL